MGSSNKKHRTKRNITGLRNQKLSKAPPTCSVLDVDDLRRGLLFDSMRIDWQKEMEAENEEPDEDEELADGDYGDEEFTHALAELAAMDDDPRDLDWIPVALRRRRALKKGQIRGRP